MTHLAKANIVHAFVSSLLFVPIRKFSRALGLAVVGFSLTSCVSAVPQRSPTASSGLTEETATIIWETAMAGSITDECPAKFRFNRNVEAAIIDEVRKRRSADEERGADFLSEAEYERFSDFFFDAYLLRRGIKSGRPETWCAAGTAEVAEKTRIGKLLIPL